MNNDNGQIVVTTPGVFGRVAELGAVVGEARDGQVTCTHEHLHAGALVAKLRLRQLTVMNDDELAEFRDKLAGIRAPEGEDGDPDGHDGHDGQDSGGVDYAGMKRDELLELVNERRRAGRNVQTASTKKKDLIAALEADDAAREAADPGNDDDGDDEETGDGNEPAPVA